MGLLFELKSIVAGVGLAEKFISSEKIDKTDKKISEKICKLDFDVEKIKQTRIKNRSNIIRLNRVMSKTYGKEFFKLKKGSLNDIRLFEKTAKKQLKDLIKTVIELRKLIENEDIEVIYDIRRPLLVFERFIRELKVVVTRIRLERKAGLSLRTIIENIEKDYEKLVEYSIKFIKNDFLYFNSVGLNFDKINAQKLRYEGQLGNAATAHENHLKNRSRLKLQISGKATSIINQINRFRQEIKGLKLKGVLPADVAETIIKKVDYFKKSFDGLVKFCIKRVDIATHMIVESIILQKERYDDIIGLKKELSSFYDEFLAETRANIQKHGEPLFKTMHYKKVQDEFTKAEGRFLEMMGDFENEIDKRIERVSHKYLKTLKLEAKEEKTIVRKVKNLKRRAKILLAAIIMPIIIGVAGGFIKGYDIKLSFANNVTVQSYRLISEAGSYVVKLASVDSKFAKKYGKNDIRYKIAHIAIKSVGSKGYYGTRTKKVLKYDAVKRKLKPVDCISFVKNVLTEATGKKQDYDRMEKIIAAYAKKGWKVYFVCKDPEDYSVKLGYKAKAVYNRAKKGNYPYVKKNVKGFIIGRKAVKKFQKKLKGKVALVSFNAGYHSALILDGNVVQAHWKSTGSLTVEGMYSFESHLSEQEKGVWEFAIVAIAPGG